MTEKEMCEKITECSNEIIKIYTKSKKYDATIFITALLDTIAIVSEESAETKAKMITALQYLIDGMFEGDVDVTEGQVLQKLKINSDKIKEGMQ